MVPASPLAGEEIKARRCDLAARGWWDLHPLSQKTVLNICYAPGTSLRNLNQSPVAYRTSLDHRWGGQEA